MNVSNILVETRTQLRNDKTNDIQIEFKYDFVVFMNNKIQSLFFAVDSEIETNID